MLGKYVREEHVLTLEEAVHKMSGLTTRQMHIADRGLIGEGLAADLVIFDPATIRDLATFEQPNQLSQGMEYVLVNGVPVIAAGKMTGALPGKVLRGPGYQPMLAASLARRSTSARDQQASEPPMHSAIP